MTLDRDAHTINEHIVALCNSKHTGSPQQTDSGNLTQRVEFLTSEHSDAQPWTSECPDVKNYK